MNTNNLVTLSRYQDEVLVEAVYVDNNAAEKEKFSKKRVVLLSLMAAFSAINFGYSVSYSGYLNPIFEETNILTRHHLKLYSSILSLGAAVGSVIFGFVLLKLIGRKFSLVGCAIISIIGWVLNFILLSDGIRSNLDVPLMLYFSRFFNGLGVGGATTCANVYIAEISPTSIYKFTGFFHQIGIGLGYAIFDTVEYILYELDVHYQEKNYHFTFLYCPLVIIIIQIIQMFFSLYLPESPVWLEIYYSKENKDKIILMNNKKLYGNENYTVIDANRLTELKKKDKSFKKLMQKLIKKGSIFSLFVGIGAMFFFQFMGVGPIIFNAGEILTNAGVDKVTVGMIIIGYSQFASAVIGIFLNRYFPVKPLLITSSIITVICHLVIGLHYMYWKDQPELSQIPLVLLVLFFFCFYMGWGANSFLINAIIYPDSITHICSGIANTTNWLFSFIIVYLYVDMLNDLGSFGVFWTFSVLSFLSALFSILFVPEIRNKSKATIVKLFEKKIFHLSFKM